MANEQIGQAIQYHKKFKFIVLIDGITIARFRKAGPVKMKLGVIKERDGGQLFPTKEPGLGEVDPFVLERGIIGDREIWDWMRLTAAIAGNGGQINPVFKKDMSVVQQSLTGRTLRRWDLTLAFPVEYEGGDWDNTAEENTTEKVTFEYDLCDLVIGET